ncbi:MAG: hypothetical protein H8E94_08950 [Alphaproteobacteria bacterium]|nr:hypothetical protein [Alphaproteobacteria bacterium]
MAEVSSASQQLQYLALVQDRLQIRKDAVQRISDADRVSGTEQDVRLLRSEELRRERLQTDLQLSLDERERARSTQLEVDLRNSQLNELDAENLQRSNLPRGSLIDINA